MADQAQRPKAIMLIDFQEGAWDEELKKAAEELPQLRDFQLPVEVNCTELATVSAES